MKPTPTRHIRGATILLLTLLITAAPAVHAAPAKETSAQRGERIKQESATKKLLTKLKSKSLTDDGRGELLDAIRKSDYGKEKLAKLYYANFLLKQKRYLAAITYKAKAEIRKKRSRDKITGLRETTERLRKTILRYSTSESLTKQQVQTHIDPALAKLEGLLVLPLEELTKIVPSLQTQREEILTDLALCRELLAELPKEVAAKAIPALPEEARSEGNLARAEKKANLQVVTMSSTARRILAKNTELFAQIDSAEADGVFALNRLRILVGLDPLLADLRIATRARGWSKEMESTKNFKHMKLSDGVSGENIAMGKTQGAATIQQWWYSPGHHRNMMRSRFRRVGLGRSGNYWTQQFGR